MSTKRIRSPSVEITSYTPAARPAGTQSASSSAAPAKKRKSTGGDDSESAPKPKRAKKAAAPAPPAVPAAERWKWINLCKPEIEFKGTKIEVFNCGGTFFKTTAKTMEMRLDKLQVFLDECKGDETCHPNYGYPERVKITVKSKKEDEEAKRWDWINRCRPEIRLKGSSLVAYNCGGQFFRATGKTIEDRLDKMEKFLAECDGDETSHHTYGHMY